MNNTLLTRHLDTQAEVMVITEKLKGDEQQLTAANKYICESLLRRGKGPVLNLSVPVQGQPSQDGYKLSRECNELGMCKTETMWKENKK